MHADTHTYMLVHATKGNLQRFYDVFIFFFFFFLFFPNKNELSRFPAAIGFRGRPKRTVVSSLARIVFRGMHSRVQRWRATPENAHRRRRWPLSFPNLPVQLNFTLWYARHRPLCQTRDPNYSQALEIRPANSFHCCTPGRD